MKGGFCIGSTVLTALVFDFAGLGVVRVFLEVHRTRDVVVNPEIGTDLKTDILTAFQPYIIPGGMRKGKKVVLKVGNLINGERDAGARNG